MRLLLPLALLLATAPVAAAAQPVTSAGPDKVAVTIYRNPHRSRGQQIEFDWLDGFALVSETRTVSIPAGRATLRFEGVAGGIVPESAVVSGMPAGVREKNLDADLLSPASLYARSYGRAVTIRRTRADGMVTEERAIVRSGSAGPAILETKSGFLAVNCGPDRESIVYDQMPPGLSAKPTLSIETEAATAATATVTLTYLATGFDWQASYVATMRPDGRTADLFAWVTLANGDVTSFADAETMVVAGKLSRDENGEDWREMTETPGFSMRCFGREIIAYYTGAPPPPPPPPPMAPPPPVEMARAEEVVVSGMKMVSQEELGDLKLYRVPDRTNVAARSQKQVALLSRGGVPVEVIHRAKIWGDDASKIDILLRMQNRERDKLGLPLPAGSVAVFQPRGDSRILVGEGAIEDKAVDEEVEIEVAESAQIAVEIDEVREDERGLRTDHVMTVTNANPFPVRFEADFQSSDDHRRSKVSARLGRKNGRDIWLVTIPANGTAKLGYRLTEAED
jgi:hypothetical protein